MIFLTSEHILNHIYFSSVLIVITIYLMTLLVHETIGLHDSSEKGMITTFYFDLYESLILLSLGFSIIHMVPKIWNLKNDLSAITAPSTIFTQGFATSGLLTEMHAAILCGSLLSVSLLVITFRKSLGVFGKNNHSLIRTFSFDFDEIQYVNERSNSILNNSLLSFRNYHRYQLIQQLDRSSY
ncbi:hypothetical protein MKX03_018622 [Papaver bracteatum]|nr:hypothetical protein MKX03_018622 [Papaver bracteatum]